MKNLIKWFKDMMDAELSVSSKRFCGVLGFFAVIFILFWCTITNTSTPETVETMLYVIAGLLGIDKISDMIKRKHKNENLD